MYTLAIEPKKQGGKGRHFQVSLLSFVTADRFWDGSSRTAYRPVFVCFAETDQQVRAFTANLRTGRPAAVRDQHGHDKPKQLEVIRSAGMKWYPRRLPTGVTIMTGYLPALCDLDPGLMPDRITFLFAPPTWWVDRQMSHPAIQALPQEVQRETVLGGYFCAFADKRSPFPIVPDPLFHRRLYLAAKKRPWFYSPAGSIHTPGPLWNFPEKELPPGLDALHFVDVGHGEFENLLRGETTRYFREESPDWLYAPEPEVFAAAPVAPDASPLAATEQEKAITTPIIIIEPEEAPAEPIAPPAATLQPVEVEEKALVETRVPGAGRVLQNPHEPAPQLSLFDLL